MSLLLLLACLCGAAARGAPTAPRCLPESELEGYCRRRLDGGAPLINGLEPAPANGTAPPVSVNADGQFLANDDTIREAVSLWFLDRAAGEATYGHISTWATGGVTNMDLLFCVRAEWMNTYIPPEIYPAFFGEGLATFMEYGDLAAFVVALNLFKDRCVLSSPSFNEDISAWDTSNVTTMAAMFYNASSFNQPIGGWRVEKVTNMALMFLDASAFNQAIGDWRVDKVTDMYQMFRSASLFDQPLGDWQVNKVTNMANMFQQASSFNQPLGDWQPASVTSMSLMFLGASSFDQSIGNWQVDQRRLTRTPTTTSLPVSRDLSLGPTRKGTGSTASSTAVELVQDSRT